MSARRVMLNTIALYGKMIVTVVISLWLTRIVLNELGENDFGIYNLIAGIIALLSFINSALMTSSQRYMSVAMGKNSIGELRTIYSSSVLIHAGMSMALLLALEIMEPLLFNGFLNIDPSRIADAKIVYQIMIVTTIATVMGVPFNAEINANEDLWFFAIVETATVLLRIGIILVFQMCSGSPLIEYAVYMMILTFINLGIKYLWCLIKYPECKRNDYSYAVNKLWIRQMLGFTGWNALGSLAIVGRNQGVAVLLNVFFGTAINAVYGIANQINSQLIYFSTMMTTSMTPQIMKSKGQGDYGRMMQLSVFTSKLAFFLSAVLAIPLIICLKDILILWLKNPPQYTYIFSVLTIIVFVILQLYPGLTRAIQAHGNIKFYQITTSVLLLLPIPVGAILYHFGYPNYTVLYVMIASQILQLFASVIITNHLVKFDYWGFLGYVFKASVCTALFLLAGHWFYTHIYSNDHIFRNVVLTCAATMPTFAAAYFMLVFSKSERSRILSLIHTR